MPTDVPQESTPSLSKCPMCGYSRAGLTHSVCPECAYTLTPQDIAHGYRWEMFVSLTHTTVAGRWVMLSLLAASALLFRAGWSRSMGPTVIFIVACVGIGAAFAGSRFVPTRGLRGRVLRRAWMLSAAFAQAFWLLPLLVYYFEEHVGSLVFGNWADDYSWESLTLTLATTGFFGAAIGMLAFKRTLAFARLSMTPTERTALVEGLKLALAPQFLVTVAAAIMGVFAVLDRVRPSWWWGT